MKSRYYIFLSFLFIATLLFSGCGCKKNQDSYQVNLEVWGLFDDSDVMAKATSAFQKRNPRVREVRYKKLTVDSYENDVLEALATGNGPDVFLVHNTWLTKHKDKLAPVPPEVVNDEQVEILNSRQIKDVFVDVVSSDFVSGEEIYALPLSVDSLALYYNRDLLNQAGIAESPTTWIEFDEAVKRITVIDSFGNITLSGAAMGTSSDASAGGGKINRATDILMLLMMQSGAEMLDSESRRAEFAEFPEGSSGREMSPGESALIYYAKFSNPLKVEYCWNSLQHNSIDSFIEGKTAMMFNYSWLVPRIQSRAPKLNFGVARALQNKDEEGRGLDIDFANYWGFAVSKNKTISEEDIDKARESRANYATNEQRVAEAWKFIRFLTMPESYNSGLQSPSQDLADYDPAAEYIEKQKKPAARRDLIEKQKKDVYLGPFVEGNLIAKSWPQPDNLAVEKIFDEMIDDVVLRNQSTRDALQKAQNAVNVLVREDGF